MNRGRSTFLALAFILVVAAVAQLVPAAAADTVWKDDFTVPAGGYTYFYAYRSDGTGLFGNFTVDTYGIKFFICNSSNFLKFQNGQTYAAYCYKDDVGSGDYAFRTPYGDTWYQVFDNKYGLIFNKDVHYTHGIDGTAPSTTISKPTADQHVSGTVSIEASSVDNHFPVWYMSISIDGSSKTGIYDSSISYSWDTRYYSNGWHTIRVYSEDTVDNSGYKEISVYVENTLYSPAITITAPSDGLHIDAGSTSQFHISASATVQYSTISSMKVTIDGVDVDSSSSGSISYWWPMSGVSNGQHTIIISATAANGQSSSMSRTVYVEGVASAPSPLLGILLVGSAIGVVGVVVAVVLIRAKSKAKV